MQVFIDEFAKHMAKQNTIIIMDQAAWHKALTLPSNIEIVFLPPYSPELNPVERLWGYIKGQVMRNKIYDKLQDLEDKVAEFVRDISDDTIRSVCKCTYIA